MDQVEQVIVESLFFLKTSKKTREAFMIVAATVTIDLSLCLTLSVSAITPTVRHYPFSCRKEGRTTVHGNKFFKILQEKIWHVQCMVDRKENKNNHVFIFYF